jgi:hypothetical protein
VDESSGVGPAGGFLADVCAAWESTVDVALLPSTRKVKLRIGFVLDRQGGALPILARLATCFLGGQAGGGRQGVSWIHLADLVSLALWLLDNDLAGPVNACAPNPVSNRELMSAIRAVLRRPWSPPVPKPALILVGKLFGPDAEITLGGQWVVPNVALKNGFVFRFPELRGALEDLLGSAP